MVVGRHQDAAPSHYAGDDHGTPHRLLYSKSKVYVHPTAYSRDNIPGFVSLVKQVSAPYTPNLSQPTEEQDSINPTYFLSWILETLLHEKGPEEWSKYTRVEETTEAANKAMSEEGMEATFCSFQTVIVLYRLSRDRKSTR